MEKEGGVQQFSEWLMERLMVSTSLKIMLVIWDYPVFRNGK